MGRKRWGVCGDLGRGGVNTAESSRMALDCG